MSDESQDNGRPLNNALPGKLTAPDLKATGNEVYIESIDIAFETLTVSSV